MRDWDRLQSAVKWLGFCETKRKILPGLSSTWWGVWRTLPLEWTQIDQLTKNPEIIEQKRIISDQNHAPRRRILCRVYWLVTYQKERAGIAGGKNWQSLTSLNKNCNVCCLPYHKCRVTILERGLHDLPKIESWDRLRDSVWCVQHLSQHKNTRMHQKWPEIERKKVRADKK